jgi:RNA polymerase sigma-70 factor (ECF subfamily)
MPSPPRASLTLVVGRTRRDVTDVELTAGLVAGEDWAVTEAWQRFAPMVLTTAERALGSRSDAEDLAQEVFVRAFRRVATLRDPASLRSFVYSIAIRTLKSELRYRRLRAWLLFRSPETLLNVRHSPPDFEARALLRNFYVLLDRLSPRHRLVFLLRRVESLTVEEIAATMDISVSTVKRSLTHASDRLSRWIDGDPGMTELLDGKFGGKYE